MRLGVRVVATVIAGVLGLALNLARLPNMPEATLQMGGIAGLAAALLFGPRYGVLAALIASLPTVFFSRYPGELAIAALEALAVGLLARRRTTPVIADLVYWVVCGVPLAILTYISFSTSRRRTVGWW